MHSQPIAFDYQHPPTNPSLGPRLLVAPQRFSVAPG